MALTEWPTKTRVAQLQLAADLDHIVRVSCQRAVFLRIVGREIGSAGADVIEQDRAEVLLERRRHEPPHVLIAAEPVREHHGALAGPPRLHVVTHDH